MESPAAPGFFAFNPVPIIHVSGYSSRIADEHVGFGGVLQKDYVSTVSRAIRELRRQHGNIVVVLECGLPDEAIVTFRGFYL